MLVSLPLLFGRLQNEMVRAHAIADELQGLVEPKSGSVIALQQLDLLTQTLHELAACLRHLTQVAPPVTLPVGLALDNCGLALLADRLRMGSADQLAPVDGEFEFFEADED